MERKYFSGATLSQALLQAARHFGIEPEAVAYRPVEKRHGFLKVRRGVVIEVDPEAPRREKGAVPQSEARRPASSAPAQVDQQVETQAEAQVERPARAEPRRGAAVATPSEERRPEPGARVPAAERPAESPGSPDRPERPRRAATEQGRRRGRGAAERVPREAPGEESRGESRGRAERRPGRAEAPARPERGLIELPEGPRRALERLPKAEGAAAEAAREGLRRLFALAEVHLEAEIFQGEEGLEVEVWGNDEEILLRDRGRVLFSVQHLLPRMIRGLTGESVPCRVDCDNYHEIRAEQLRDLAQRTASEVQQRGRLRTLEPMSPDERRIVHLTLTDDPTVETESKGQGLFKRVTIRPARRG